MNLQLFFIFYFIILPGNYYVFVQLLSPHGMFIDNIIYTNNTLEIEKQVLKWVGYLYLSKERLKIPLALIKISTYKILKKSVVQSWKSNLERNIKIPCLLFQDSKPVVKSNSKVNLMRECLRCLKHHHMVSFDVKLCLCLV